MKNALVVLVTVIAMTAISCATMKQDVPTSPEQCFEGKFSIYRVLSEKWEVVGQSGNIYFLGNPKAGEYPKIVAVLINPYTGLIMRYAYLDGKKIVFYRFNVVGQKGCYITDDSIPPKIQDQIKQHILNPTKERLVKK